MLKIYGASDDLVELEGCVEDEIGCYDKWVEITVGYTEAEPGRDTQGVKVIMRYAPKWADAGVWTAEVFPLDEGVEIPWPVKIELSERKYSAQVVIDCPDGTPVKWKKISAANRE